MTEAFQVDIDNLIARHPRFLRWLEKPIAVFDAADEIAILVDVRDEFFRVRVVPYMGVHLHAVGSLYCFGKFFGLFGYYSAAIENRRVGWHDLNSFYPRLMFKGALYRLLDNMCRVSEEFTQLLENHRDLSADQRYAIEALRREDQPERGF